MKYEYYKNRFDLLKQEKYRVHDNLNNYVKL